MNIFDLFSRPLLEESLAKGHVYRKEHPTLPLSLLNYSSRAQFDAVWNPVTLSCRGLIFHRHSLDIVARPFPKFFSPDQHRGTFGQLPTGPCEVLEKCDGSLGIVYSTPDGPAVSTRGAFDSEQAIWATEMLQKLSLPIVPGKTILVEIIAPFNRIVVDYGQAAELVFLDCLHNATGASVPCPGPYQDLKAARRFPYTSLQEALDAPQVKNEEGFVVRYASGERLKVKFDDYVLRHKALTGFSAKWVLQVMLSTADHDQARAMYSLLPDELYADALAYEAYYIDARQSLLAKAHEIAESVKHLPRKQAAKVIMASDCVPGLVFDYMDGKDLERRFARMLSKLEPSIEALRK